MEIQRRRRPEPHDVSHDSRADGAPPPSAEPHPSPRPAATRERPVPPPPLGGVDDEIGRAILAYVREQGAPKPAPKPPERAPKPAPKAPETPKPSKPRNDDVLYVGMNSHGGQYRLEARTLKRAARGHVDVVAHAETNPAIGADHARIPSPTGGTRVVDLSTEEGARAFAASLGLPPQQQAKIASILQHATSGSRDELAEIARVFAKGERGEHMPARLVLSGHCVGSAVYDGDFKLGRLDFRDVFALADAMPKAAANIQDVMLSACSSGYESSSGHVGLGEWRQHFPNLETAWGYGGGADFHSPSGTDAQRQIRAWEKKTRGHTEHIDPGKIARGSRHWKNIATWTADDGYTPGRT